MLYKVLFIHIYIYIYICICICITIYNIAAKEVAKEAAKEEILPENKPVEPVHSEIVHDIVANENGELELGSRQRDPNPKDSSKISYIPIIYASKITIEFVCHSGAAAARRAAAGREEGE